MIMRWIFGTFVLVGVTIVLGFMLVFTGSPATENPDDTRKLASALVTGGNGTSEGIEVHGDWVIEVSDPDGNLVERREFKNALTDEGKQMMLNLLVGTESIVNNTWEIRLTYDREYRKWTAIPSGEKYFNIVTTEDTGTGVGVIEVQGWNYIPGGFGLSGSIVLEKKVEVTNVDWFTGDTITSVGTSVQALLAVKNETNKHSFTEHTLDDPLEVTYGSTIMVTVNISVD